MKIETHIKIPKTDFDDYTRAEQKVMALRAAVTGGLQTDYIGVDKAISVRMNAMNTPKVEALAELSKLSKNLVINNVMELGFSVLEENLSEEEFKLFKEAEARKTEEWLFPEGSEYVPREKK